MSYLLDTNVCIAWLNGDVSVKKRLLELRPSDVCTSVVVRAELVFGAMASSRAAANARHVQAFLAPIACVGVDDAVADEYGALRAELHRQGTPVGPNDLFIAATARLLGHTLVTRNVRELERIPRLALERW